MIRHAAHSFYVPWWAWASEGEAHKRKKREEVGLPIYSVLVSTDGQAKARGHVKIC